jgi:hypothetical protein
MICVISSQEAGVVQIFEVSPEDPTPNYPNQVYPKEAPPPFDSGDDGDTVIEFDLTYWLTRSASLNARADSMLAINTIILNAINTLSAAIASLVTAVTAIDDTTTKGFQDADQFYEWYKFDYGISLLTLIFNAIALNFLCSDVSLVVAKLKSFTSIFLDMDGNPVTDLLFAPLEAILTKIVDQDAVKTHSKLNIATANLYNAMQQIAASCFRGLNIISSSIAQWGNALKIYGVVGWFAYPWQNYQSDYNNSTTKDK